MKQIWNDIHGEVHPHTALDFLPKEQLRALQAGMKIITAVVNCKPIGIDTQEDLDKFASAIG